MTLSTNYLSAMIPEYQGEKADLHRVGREETLDVEVGRVLVFERVVYYRVVFLYPSVFVIDTKRNEGRTDLGELAGDVGLLEIGVVGMSVIDVFEPGRQLM
jgi:uncharacterized protein Veg